MKAISTTIFLLSIIGISAFPAFSQVDWEKVTAPRVWSFPRDFGAHPEYRTEWWYFTGNLTDRSGARYGYQLTFFRQGIRRNFPSPANPWDIQDLYLAHFAITDVSRNLFRASDRVSRSGPGLAGAGLAGMNVWLFNWSARMKNGLIFLEGRDSAMEIQLQLAPRKPPVLHGEEGFSRKGPLAGQSSYYVSLTDLKTTGRLKLGSGTFVEIDGTSWFDQEFGSNQLAPDQKGWDWFSLHLSDGRDLMIYFLRLKDGNLEPASSGTLIMPNGVSRHLKFSEVPVSVLQHWESPHSKGEYPSRWRIRVPSAGIDLTVTPLIPDQELNTRATTGVTYWEGAVSGQGTSDGHMVSCEGYVELTGYAGALGGLF